MFFSASWTDIQSTAQKCKQVIATLLFFYVELSLGFMIPFVQAVAIIVGGFCFVFILFFHFLIYTFALFT